MNNPEAFERQLRDALRRVDAPPGFAERVVAKAAARERAKHVPVRRWLAVAASVLLVVSGGVYGEHYRREQIRRQQAEAARAQLVVALRITSRQIEKVEERLRAIGVKEIEIKEVAE